MSQLGLGLGLTRGGGVPFNPLSLDPYLLFDTRSSMIGTFENPTLDLDPSDPDTLDVITATRSGVATYTDEDGLIQSASADTVRVDYTQGEELTPTKFQNIGYTDFSQDWTLEGSTLPESQTTAPDGTTPVYELTENTGTSRHRLFLTGISLVVGQDYTVSAYVKKVSSGRFFLINSSALNGIKGFLNLDTGVATLTSGTGTIAVTDEGNGWYRLSVTAQATTTNGFVYMQLQDAQTDVNYTGTGASMLIWGPQLEEGTTASDFVANTTGSPKFITGATYGPRVPMILVEPSATNLVTNSNSSNLNFALDDVSMTYNVTGSPDGETNGILFEQTGNNANNSAYNYGLPNTDGAYSYSIFIKAADSSLVRFRSDNGTILVQDFNPQTMTSGTLAGGLNLKFEDYGNGWFRVSFTRTLSSAPYNRFQIYPDRNNTQKGLHIFGLQVESGSTVATSYIPTSGSTVTRQADDLVITGSDFDFYNASEGTVYIELTSEDGRNSYPVYFTQNGAGFAYRNNGTWVIQKDGGSYVTLASWANGGFVSDSFINLGTYTAGDLTRVSVSYDSNSYEGSKDGASVQTSTPTTMATTLVDRLYVGGAADFQNSSRIKRLIYWPYSSDNL